jgi:hypothetical protein
LFRGDERRQAKENCKTGNTAGRQIILATKVGGIQLITYPPAI